MAIPAPNQAQPKRYQPSGVDNFARTMQLQQMQMDPLYRSMNSQAGIIQKYMADPESISDKDYETYIIPATEALNIDRQALADKSGDAASTLDNFGAFLGGGIDQMVWGVIPDKWYSSRRTKNAANYGQWFGLAVSAGLLKYGMVGSTGRAAKLLKSTKGAIKGQMAKPGAQVVAKKASALKAQVKGILNQSPQATRIMNSAKGKDFLNTVTKTTEKILRSKAMQYTMPGMMYRGGQRVAGQVSRLAGKGVPWAQKVKPYLEGGIAGETGNLARRAAKAAASGNTDDAMRILKEAVETGGVDVVGKVTAGMKGVQKTLVTDMLAKPGMKAAGADAREIITKILGFKRATASEVGKVQSWVRRLPKLVGDGLSPKELAKAAGLSKSKTKILEAVLDNKKTRNQFLKQIKAGVGDIGWKDYISGLAGPAGGVATGLTAAYAGSEYLRDRGPETSMFHKNYGQ